MSVFPAPTVFQGTQLDSTTRAATERSFIVEVEVASFPDRPESTLVTTMEAGKSSAWATIEAATGVKFERASVV